MRNLALFGASALVLAVGVAQAQPSGPQFLTRGQDGGVATDAPTASGATADEGRAAFAMGSLNSNPLVQSPASCAPDWAEAVWAPGNPEPIGFSCRPQQ